MINTMFLFRSDLRIFETYHYCDTIEEYKKKCWDFYVNQGIWALENDILKNFVVWRLKPKIFKGLMPVSWREKNGNVFSQKFIESFKNFWIYSMYMNSDVAFFRGGFKCYDQMLKNNALRFKYTTKLYCGSGRRIFPQYGGKYDLHLVEDEKDFNKKYKCIPFYKTANPNIFYNMNIKDKKYDICFPCNFSSKKYKGQEFLIQQISKSKFLKNLKIVHTGNNPSSGKKMCKKYNVKNIIFLDHLDREEVNKILNQSKFGLVCSNRSDGCPRIVSEILSSGTPLLIRNTTRLLDYYKKYGVQTFSDNNISKKIEKAFSNYKSLKEELNNNIDRFSMDRICRMNFKIWNENELQKK